MLSCRLRPDTTDSESSTKTKKRASAKGRKTKKQPKKGKYETAILDAELLELIEDEPATSRASPSPGSVFSSAPGTSSLHAMMTRRKDKANETAGIHAVSVSSRADDAQQLQRNTRIVEQQQQQSAFVALLRTCDTVGEVLQRYRSEACGKDYRYREDRYRYRYRYRFRYININTDTQTEAHTEIDTGIGIGIGISIGIGIGIVATVCVLDTDTDIDIDTNTHSLNTRDI